MTDRGEAVSAGRLCDCPRLDHISELTPDPDLLELQPGSCRRYAADQERGGLCSDCVSWTHKWTPAKRTELGR